jgi:6-pyruvoyl-tetrahydropterin synthase
MNYNKTVIISVAHFNDQDTYEQYDAAIAALNKSAVLLTRNNPTDAVEKLMGAYNHLHQVLKSQHGHDFKVKVSAFSATLDPRSFVVDDEKLTRIIMQWDRCKVTLHHDFSEHLKRGTRISTELMVVVLKEKLSKEWPETSFKVEIWEGDNISVSA